MQAFQALGVSVDGARIMEARKQLSKDPPGLLNEALCLLGVVLNTLRNAEGTGHGRPFLPSLDEATARAATEAVGLLAGVLLERLDPKEGNP